MPDQSVTEKQVLEALSTVKEPELGRDLVSLGFVKDVAIRDGEVSFTITLTTPACPMKEQMQRESEQAIRHRFPQVKSVRVGFDARVRADRRIQEKLNLTIRNIIAVGSGKGGVGKSTVSVNLAVGLAAEGASVGILDADVYGPNVPMLMGVTELPPPSGDKLVPARAFGVEVVSMGFLVGSEEALVWRGPMIHGALKQLFSDVLWGDLDYLVVDLPPGTGDAQLSVAQLVPLTGGVVVTTPQKLAVSDARRGVTAFRRLNVPVLGIVENMTGEIFGSGGGRAAAEELGVPFLGSIPLDPAVVRMGDEGRPPAAANQHGPTSEAFRALARAIAARVSVQQFEKEGGVPPKESAAKGGGVPRPA